MCLFKYIYYVIKDNKDKLFWNEIFKCTPMIFYQNKTIWDWHKIDKNFELIMDLVFI